MEQIQSTKPMIHSIKWITLSRWVGRVCFQMGGRTGCQSEHCWAGRPHSTVLSFSTCPLARGPEVLAMPRRSSSCILHPLQHGQLKWLRVLLQISPNDPPSVPWGSQAPKSWISKASYPWHRKWFPHVKFCRLNLFRKGSLWNLKQWNLLALWHRNKKLKDLSLEIH